MTTSGFKVFWTKEAKSSINKVIKHLEEEWTEKEISTFFDEVDRIVDLIAIHPKLFRISKKRNNIHMALINKHVFLVYQVKPSKKQIALLLFWGTRQNPRELKY